MTAHASLAHGAGDKYRPDIDGLRAVAVLSVVIFHAFPDRLKGGFVGVDVFFVISGFLISGIIFDELERQRFSFQDFYGRRIRRIFPALLLVLATCFSFGWFALLADEYRQLGKHIAGGAGFISNFMLWNESGYFDEATETKPLLHLWSLGIEEQFYIVWPLLVWLAWRRAMLVPALLVLGLGSFAANVWMLRADLVADFYSPLTRFWELLAGSGLAWFAMRRRAGGGASAAPEGAALAHLLSVGGALMILASLALINDESRFPGWWALLPVLGAVMVIAAGRQGWFNRHVLSSRFMVGIGLISFPLYLWHWPLLSFARIIESETPSRAVRAGAVLASIALAWLTWRLVEHPLRFGAHRRLKTVALAGLMVVAGGVGVLTMARDGFENRQAVRLYKNYNNELKLADEVDDACRAYVGVPAGQSPVFPYCRHAPGDGARTVAVIGDSHALAAYGGIAEVLRGSGVGAVLLGNSGCPTILGAEYGDTPAEKDLCRRRILGVIETVVARKDIEHVFMFTRGPVYLSGKGYGPAERHINTEPRIPPAEFLAKMQQTVDHLRRAGKVVHYVHENPELGVPPGACAARPFRDRPRVCEQDLAGVMVRHGEYLALTRGLRDVTLVHTLDHFCPGGLCRVFSEAGDILYADDDHVSTAGSLFQAQAILGPHLAAITGGPRPAVTVRLARPVDVGMN